MLSQMIRLRQTTCCKLQKENDNVNMKNHRVAQTSSKKNQKRKVEGRKSSRHEVKKKGAAFFGR